MAIGESSYGFYILHLPILIGWAAVLRAWGMGEDRAVFALALSLTLPVTLAAAHVSYRHFEAPINRWAKQRFRGAQLPPVLTPPAPAHAA